MAINIQMLQAFWKYGKIPKDASFWAPNKAGDSASPKFKICYIYK